MKVSLAAVFVPLRKRPFLCISVASGKQEMFLSLGQVDYVIILIASVEKQFADLKLERKIESSFARL